MEPDDIITVADVRDAGYCLRPGAQRWFEAQGLDFRKFIRTGGIPYREVMHLKDAVVDSVVAKKMEKKNG